MAQLYKAARASGQNGSTTVRFKSVRQTVYLTALLALLWSAESSAQAIPANCPANLATADIINHDFSVSFCELCDVGTVRMEIENPYRNQDDVDFSDIVVTENLNISGLTYLPGTTRFFGNNIAAPPLVEPVVSGANGSILTWTLSNQYVIDAPNGNFGNTPRVTIEFDVRRHAAVGEEGLVAANRTIEAAVEFTPSCEVTYRHTDTTGPGVLPLREPEPQVIKSGRNLDAGQGSNSYSDPMYGHENDDAIWRIEVRNNGQANLQDFIFSDTMQPGNFEIDYICDSEGDATSAASGGGVGNCQAAPNATQLTDVSVEALFGGGATPYIAAPAGNSGFYYLVGRITDSCTNQTNTVYDVEWGCEVQAPPGGIAATSAGLIAAPDVALLSTLAEANSLDVNVALTGTNTSQPMGSNGTVTITISNNTGGTIKGGATGLRLRDVLPAEYVIDSTFDPTVQMVPAYGNNYEGMLDTIQ
jgi:hypothetical protein